MDKKRILRAVIARGKIKPKIKILLQSLDMGKMLYTSDVQFGHGMREELRSPKSVLLYFNNTNLYHPGTIISISSLQKFSC